MINLEYFELKTAEAVAQWADMRIAELKQELTDEA